jgi:hypothetical protein
LRAVTGALRRADPTRRWKAEILERAQRDSHVTPFKRMLPPRWLMLGWAACWMITIFLYALTPGELTPALADRTAARRPVELRSHALIEHQAMLLALLAQNESAISMTHP